MKAHVVFSRGLKERVRAFNVRLQKGRRIRNRIVVVAFRRKVHTGIGFGKEFHGQVRITNVTFHKCEAVSGEPRKVREVASVGEFIQHRDMPPWVHEYPMHKVGTDESRTARDDQPLNFRHVEPLFFGGHQ